MRAGDRRKPSTSPFQSRDRQGAVELPRSLTVAALTKPDAGTAGVVLNRGTLNFIEPAAGPSAQPQRETYRGCRAARLNSGTGLPRRRRLTWPKPRADANSAARTRSRVKPEPVHVTASNDREPAEQTSVLHRGADHYARGRRIRRRRIAGSHRRSRYVRAAAASGSTYADGRKTIDEGYRLRRGDQQPLRGDQTRQHAHQRICSR